MVKKPIQQTEKLEAFRQKLADRRARAPWHSIARQMDEVIAATAGSGEARREKAFRVAKEATGLDRALLGRYLTTLRRVKAAAAVLGIDPDGLLTVGFNGLEMAVRLYDRSPERGLEAFQGLKSGRMQLEEIRRMLAEAPQGKASDDVTVRSRALRQRASEIQAVETAIEQSVGTLFPKDSIARRRRGLLYFHRVGMEVVGKDGTTICGLDIVAADPDSNRDKLDAVVAPVILLSTFFPKFYVVFSPGSDPSAVDEAVEALDLIDARWVGVMKVTVGSEVEVVRKPVGVPVPDRTSRYESLKSALSVGRVSGDKK
jgi:DNA-binding transcriptional MerR regulator